MHRDPELFFVLGNPRSGTSLLRLMLNAHPDIAVPPECGFALWLSDRYAGLDLGDPETLSRFAADVAASRKFETWNLPEARLRGRLADRRFADYPALSREVYAAWAEMQGRAPALLGDKNNWYVAEAERLMEAFPEARIVHLVRDGRDVACSYLDLAAREIESPYRPRLPTDLTRIGEEWAGNCLRLGALEGPRMHALRYEDLLAAPEAELGRLCRFLGVDFDPAMLEFFRRNDEPEDFLQWKAKTLEPLDPANAGRFRERLSAGQIAAFESVAAEALERFGYRPEAGAAT